MDVLLDLAPHSADLSQLSDASSRYRFDEIFRDAGSQSRRARKSKLALLRQVDPELERALDPGETVRFVTWGIEHSSWDMVFMGLWMTWFNRRALIFTDRRVLMFDCRGTSRLRHLRFQVRYSAVRKARCRFGGSIRLWFANGRGTTWTGIPSKDRQSVATWLEGQGARATGPQGKEDLCTDCFAPQVGRPGFCPRCGQVFKTTRRAALLSFMLPGLGDLYLGHRVMGCLELLGVGLVWLSLILGALDPETEIGFAEAAVLFPLFMGIFHAIDALHTARMAGKGLYPARGKRVSVGVTASAPTLPSIDPRLVPTGLHSAAPNGGLGNALKWSALGLAVLAVSGATQLVELRRGSFERWEAECAAGDAKRCLNLGYIYRTGDGVPQDSVRGAALYTRACDLGSAHACRNLGYLYRNGLGVEADLDRARALYEFACDNDDGGGCNNLGILFRDGSGVEPDANRAQGFFRRGCELGDANACDHVAAF